MDKWEGNRLLEGKGMDGIHGKVPVTTLIARECQSPLEPTQQTHPNSHSSQWLQVLDITHEKEKGEKLFLNGKGFKICWHCTDKWGTLSDSGTVGVSGGTDTLCEMKL